MKRLHSLFVLIIITMSVELCAQTTYVTYGYDNCGNRLQRSILLVPEYKSAIVDNLLNHQEESIPEAPIIKIYPNPTRGILRLDISSIDLDSKVDVRIFNITGDLVFQKLNISISAPIDINALHDGAYIFKLYISGQTFSGKIVKNSE